MEFDMNRTWSQGIALVQSNFQLLAIIAGVFLLLPSMLMYVAMPDFFTLLQTTDDPEQISNMMAGMVGSLIGFFLFALLCQLIGYMAMIALMGKYRPTVGEALRASAGGLLTMLGSTVIMMVIYFVLALALSVVMGVLIAGMTMVAGEGVAIAVTFLMVIAMIVAIVYVATRFTVTMPVIILEGQRNPFTVLGRSWTLTKRHAGKIFLFYILLTVAYLVLSLIFGAVVGVLAMFMGGATGPALIMGLANGVVAALVAMVFSGIIVSMYQQLAGTSAEQIGDTFD